MSIFQVIFRHLQKYDLPERSETPKERAIGSFPILIISFYYLCRLRNQIGINVYILDRIVQYHGKEEETHH